MNPNPGDLQVAAPTPLGDNVEEQVQEIQKRARTLGEFVELVFVEVLLPLSADYPLLREERIKRRIQRYVKPWPLWVLRISAEVLAVRFPKVPKQTIFEGLRFLHFLALEFRIDGTNCDDPPPLPDFDKKVLGAMAGHLFAHFLRHEAAIQAIPVESPRGAKFRSLADLEKLFVPMLAEYLKEFPEGFLGFNSALEEAKESTFDKAGNLKETQLAPVYRKILSDWPEIECLSGPKALAERLSPLLRNRDFEDRYERVKKICQRMEITFQPFVKGQ